MYGVIAAMGGLAIQQSRTGVVLAGGLTSGPEYG
jgi:hypothetical protein